MNLLPLIFGRVKPLFYALAYFLAYVAKPLNVSFIRPLKIKDTIRPLKIGYPSN